VCTKKENFTCSQARGGANDGIEGHAYRAMRGIALSEGEKGGIWESTCFWERQFGYKHW